MCKSVLVVFVFVCVCVLCVCGCFLARVSSCRLCASPYPLVAVVFVVVFQVFQVFVIAAVCFVVLVSFLSYSLGVRCLFGCFVISIRISPRKVGFF